MNKLGASRHRNSSATASATADQPQRADEAKLAQRGGAQVTIVQILHPPPASFPITVSCFRVPHLQQLPAGVVRVVDFQGQVSRNGRRGVHILGKLQVSISTHSLMSRPSLCTHAWARRPFRTTLGLPLSMLWFGALIRHLPPSGMWPTMDILSHRMIHEVELAFLRILRMPCMLRPMYSSRCCASRATACKTASQ